MKTLDDLTKKDLMKLVYELGELSEDNLEFVKNFMDEVGEKVVDIDSILKRRKKAMDKAIFNYDYDEYFPHYDFDKVEALLKSFSRTYKNQLNAVAEFYVYTCCRAHSITMEFGDIDEDYYDAIAVWYEAACELVLSLKESDEKKNLIESLEVMKDEASPIGWGYGDMICESFAILAK